MRKIDRGSSTWKMLNSENYLQSLLMHKIANYKEPVLQIINLKELRKGVNHIIFDQNFKCESDMPLHNMEDQFKYRPQSLKEEIHHRFYIYIYIQQ